MRWAAAGAAATAGVWGAESHRFRVPFAGRFTLLALSCHFFSPLLLSSLSLSLSLLICAGPGFHHAALDEVVREGEHDLRFFRGYVASVGPDRRVPRVVLERLCGGREGREGDGGGKTMEERKEASRSLCRFVDAHASLALQSDLADYRGPRLDDYRGSGYSRGHLAAAGEEIFDLDVDFEI